MFKIETDLNNFFSTCLEKNNEKKELKEKGKELYQQALEIIKRNGICWMKQPEFTKKFIKNPASHEAIPFVQLKDKEITDVLDLAIVAEAKRKQSVNSSDFAGNIFIFIKKHMEPEIKAVVKLGEEGDIFYCLPTKKSRTFKRWNRINNLEMINLKKMINTMGKSLRNPFRTYSLNNENL